MGTLPELSGKREKLVIGLMSGTSVDGIDAVLVRLRGNYRDTSVEELAFETFPYTQDTRSRIFDLFERASAKDICHMNFFLGELFAEAAIEVAKKADIRLEQIDLIGSHGQTVYHIPQPVTHGSYSIRSTLQIGEATVIAHKTGVITVSDFRVADMAAGGTGAPLVPYTEFLLYASDTENIALQNIGGIGNITVIPQKAGIDDIAAFDTGPGNMVIDNMISRNDVSANTVSGIGGVPLRYDKDGETAAKGHVCEEALSHFMQNPFFKKQPPKAAGRENFGEAFCDEFYSYCKTCKLSLADTVATATALTAESIRHAIKNHVTMPVQKLVIGGGGRHNKTLMNMLRSRLPWLDLCTQEDLGSNSDSKEAVAFAVLANESICGNTGNLPRVTGASRPKILGKISPA